MNNLIELNSSRNPKITDLSFCPNLQILDASGRDSKITYDSIKHLNKLIELRIRYNPNATDFLSCPNLKKIIKYD